MLPGYWLLMTCFMFLETSVFSTVEEVEKDPCQKQNGCHCENTTTINKETKLKCCCQGESITEIPKNFTSSLIKL